MGLEESADAIVPGRDVPGRAKPLGAGSRPDDSVGVGPQEKTRRASSSWRGAPLGRRRGRKPICAHRGAASVVGVGGEASLGAEVLGATKLRGTAGYEIRTSGGVGGRGARAPLPPVCDCPQSGGERAPTRRRHRSNPISRSGP